jgi:hypothetical protein
MATASGKERVFMMKLDPPGVAFEQEWIRGAA